MNDFEQYARHFSAGMRVGIGIPLPYGEIFRDWAVIRAIDEDLVSLQLSRDELPEKVSLHEGQILEIRGGTDNAAFSVRGIIVDERRLRELLLRFIGEVVSDELREFYRVDAFLPVTLKRSEEQRPDVLEKQWHARRLGRLEDEQRHRQHPTVSDLPWPLPLAANISGGGVRLATHQEFTVNEYVVMEIVVPDPHRIIDAVARVAFVAAVKAPSSDGQLFETGLQFICIHEHDRDLIIRYISGIQLKRIRQLREHLDLPPVTEPPATAPDWRLYIRKGAVWLLAGVAIWLLVRYVRGYMSGHPKNEIGEIFEHGVRRYLDLQRR